MRLHYGILFAFIALQARDTQITAPLSEKGERHVTILSCSYNNARYYQRNLDSVFSQKYDNFHLIYIVDCATDQTYELVSKYIRDHGVEDKVILVNNTVHRGALYNQYHAIHQFCKDTDLVIILDGDDFFAHENVLSYMNRVYSDPNVWLTYGQFRVWPNGGHGWCCKYPDSVVQKNAFRGHAHNPSHLRTFYAGLFKQIEKDDLMYEGNFFQMSPDNAAMFPMIEMAHDHWKFVDQVLLLWNSENNLNEHKVIPGLQRKLDLVIRSMPRYSKIDSPFRTVHETDTGEV